MWTVVQFSLLRERDYRAAFDLLAEAGFHHHRSPRPHDASAFPAAVVADVSYEPAAITRAVFEALGAARLAPLAVMAAVADVRQAANSPRALAQA